MSDGLTPRLRAYLDSQAHREAFEDLSAAEINKMDMDQFARLTGRPTLGQIAEQAFAVPSTPPAPQPQQASPAVPDAPQQVELTADQIRDMDWDEYAELRRATGIDRMSTSHAKHTFVSLTRK